jgi:hypothetical protein
MRGGWVRDQLADEGGFDLEPVLLVIPAMTASFWSVANVPLAAMVLVIEGLGAGRPLRYGRLGRNSQFIRKLSHSCSREQTARTNQTAACEAADAAIVFGEPSFLFQDEPIRLHCLDRAAPHAR